MKIPEPSFDHIVRMTDSRGTFEHADHTTPRFEHGYCTDDMARVLVAAAREPSPPPEVADLARIALQFLVEAQDSAGASRNRMDHQGRWLDQPDLDDCWGRSLWGLGTAVARSTDDTVRQSAMTAFDKGVDRRAISPRTMAFAALGCAEVLAHDHDHAKARALMVDALAVIGTRHPRSTWRWPEPRLTYANAALPEAMIAAGVALERSALLEEGLDLLGWLVDHETADDRLSVVAVGGSGPHDRAPAFDQQPIEVAALADACARASAASADRQWITGLDHAVEWFLGNNDVDAVMWDPASNGGYDGLCADGPNLNQGAESTLALITTLQHARLLVPLAH